MNGLYDKNIKDDKFCVICELNKKSKIAVKTPVGITERFEIQENILQGGQWGPIQCSIEVDEIGKECLDSGEKLYKYKDCVDILSLIHI